MVKVKGECRELITSRLFINRLALTVTIDNILCRQVFENIIEHEHEHIVNQFDEKVVCIENYSLSFITVK